MVDEGGRMCDDNVRPSKVGTGKGKVMEGGSKVSLVQREP
jgi:hypothetical protein